MAKQKARDTVVNHPGSDIDQVFKDQMMQSLCVLGEYSDTWQEICVTYPDEDWDKAASTPALELDQWITDKNHLKWLAKHTKKI